MVRQGTYPDDYVMHHEQDGSITLTNPDKSWARWDPEAIPSSSPCGRSPSGPTTCSRSRRRTTLPWTPARWQGSFPLEAVHPRLLELAAAYPPAGDDLRGADEVVVRLIEDLSDLARLDTIGLSAWLQRYEADLAQLSAASGQVRDDLGLPPISNPTVTPSPAP